MLVSGKIAQGRTHGRSMAHHLADKSEGWETDAAAEFKAKVRATGLVGCFFKQKPHSRVRDSVVGMI
jgi:hypothetical protein